MSVAIVDYGSGNLHSAAKLCFYKVAPETSCRRGAGWKRERELPG